MINHNPSNSPCGSDNCRTPGASGLDQGPGSGALARSLAFQAWVWGSAESLAGIAGDTGLELLAQTVVIETFADQYELVFARAAPIAVI